MTPDVQRAWRELTLQNAQVCAAWRKVREKCDDVQALHAWLDAMKRQGDALARYMDEMSNRVRVLRRP